MAYKAFQDWYHEAVINHLLLYTYEGKLISPPFCTENCKDYNRMMVYDGNIDYIDLDVPPATSKTNAVIEVDGDLWIIPYGIYDDFNVVVQIKDYKPINHFIDKKGKGQFYSAATSGDSGFSFPLGYEDTCYGIYIKDQTVHTIDFDTGGKTKLHMGCIYEKGKFWSMPRCDEPGYVNLVSFDGENLRSRKLDKIDPTITRKYTDLLSVDGKLYALPFGETPGLREIIEYDIDNDNFEYYSIPGRDFTKKYNSFINVDKKIIGLPYGDEHDHDSNLGIVFDVETKEIIRFDIGIGHGGKYRYRSGIEYNHYAFFFPSGTPQCPIIKVDIAGEIKKTLYLSQYMLGRAVLWKEKICVMAYEISSHRNLILIFDEDLNYEIEISL